MASLSGSHIDLIRFRRRLRITTSSTTETCARQARARHRRSHQSRQLVARAITLRDFPTPFCTDNQPTALAAGRTTRTSSRSRRGGARRAATRCWTRWTWSTLCSGLPRGAALGLTRCLNRYTSSPSRSLSPFRHWPGASRASVDVRSTIRSCDRSTRMSQASICWRSSSPLACSCSSAF